MSSSFYPKLILPLILLSLVVAVRASVSGSPSKTIRIYFVSDSPSILAPLHHDLVAFRSREAALRAREDLNEWTRFTDTRWHVYAFDIPSVGILIK